MRQGTSHVPDPYVANKTPSRMSSARSTGLAIANSINNMRPQIVARSRRSTRAALLLAAGATIPPEADDLANDQNDDAGYLRKVSGDAAYLRKVAAAGGFPAYEKAHRQTLVALAAKAFPRLPTEVAAQVVAFAFHVGYY